MRKFYLLKTLAIPRMKIHCLALFLFSIFLTACATLSEDECRMGDWYSIGHQDGARGYPGDQIHRHREACGKYHIVPNTNEYHRGRKVGLLSYCTPQNGLQEGISGNLYYNVCPEHLADAFLKHYRHGFKIYETKERIKSIYASIENKEEELEKPGLTSHKKATLKRQLRELEDEKNRLQILLTTMEVVDLIKSY